MTADKTVSSREREGALHIVKHCGRLAADETVAIISDPTTREIARLLTEAAQSVGGRVNTIEIPPLAMHGQEPNSAAAQAMREASLVIGVTAKSMAHTAARRDACLNGARYLSLPDYSLALLANPAITIDYVGPGGRARTLADLFTAGKKVRVVSARGTDLTLDIGGRIGNCCPGYVTRAGDLGSPPDIEANVSPVEDKSEGRIVVDGSIAYPEFGLLRDAVTLTIEHGAIAHIDGDADLVGRLHRLFDTSDGRKTRILAECGVGLNPAAQLTGVMLTDEGALGTIHFGFGSNATVGGLNDVPFHVDFVMRAPVLTVDGKVVLDDGKYVL